MNAPIGTEQLRSLDASHHLHSFTDSRQMAEAGGTRIMARGEGVHVYTAEGKRFLDGMAGLWCLNVGYGRRELAQAAADQMIELSYYNTFFNCSPRVTIELAARLASITPSGVSHFLFCNSGSEANDSIMKLVRLYWKLEGQPSRKIFVARDYAYHGVTMATASLSGLTDMHPQWDLPLPGLVSHIEAPYWYKHGGTMDPEEFGLKCARALETRILELGPDKVAAFIGEPVYGAGGVMVPPASYWPEIQRICRKHGVLLVADEVVCGFGRTGSWFGSDTYGIQPDFMTLAKGLSSGYAPIAAVGIHDRIAQVLREKAGEIVHGFTYSGHPVSAAVALRNLRILEEERLVERVRDDVGPYLQSRFHSLLDHPLVGEVRGVGLLAAVEIVKDKVTRETWGDKRAAYLVRAHCFEQGIIMRAARDCLYCSPPFIITRKQIDELVDTFRRCLDLAAKDLGVRA
jgi:putrescine aminotransferase